MNVLILGGDLRYLEIIDGLSCKYNVDVVGYKNKELNRKIKNIDINNVKINKYDIIIFPVNGVMENNMIKCDFNDNNIKVDDNFLVNSKKNVLIFSGISTPSLDKLLKLSNRKCEFMMNDLDVVEQNAIPTVEGIIADVINNTDKTINNSDILVFGYGNVGTVLVDYLYKLGANVNVGIIEEYDKKKLDSFKIKNFYSNNLFDLICSLNESDVIINTVPSSVIDDLFIRYIKKDCYVLDISSYPHGINRDVLNKYFIKNKLYLGIPGKVAPKTSGKILCKKINNFIGDF